MSEVTPAQILALAKLSGLTPDPQATRDVAAAAMIVRAKQNGASWRQVGSTMGCGAAEAKARWKRLAKAANGALLRAEVDRMRAAADAERREVLAALASRLADG